MRIEIFSAAANDRTGYLYAQARAYGFGTRSGGYYVPPENPKFPVAAIEQAKVFIAGAVFPVVKADVMGIVRM
jgi:hypothetical protein